MFEGKNIHYTPEGKPLCSFSNKLCRQRRLNRFAFCIRHILEDKSAPFKRCQYVTRNNNQICQNPIPTSQEQKYCHAHMQCAGIIPRTERKIKNPVIKGDPNTNGVVQSKANSNNTNNNSSNNKIVQKDPNAVFKFEEEHSEIQWIPKGGSINGIVNGGKSSNVSKGKDLHNLKKEFNDDIFKGHVSNGTSVDKREGKDHGKKNQSSVVQIASNGVHPVKGKSRQTYGKKSNGKTANTNNESLIVNSTQLGSCVRDRWKKEEESNHYQNNKVKDKKVNELKCGDVVPRCVPEQDTCFEQLQTLKTVENSVVKLETGEQKSRTISGSVNNVGNAKAILDSKDSVVRTASFIPTLNNHNNHYNNIKNNNNSLPVNKNQEVCKGLVSLNRRKSSSNCNLNNSHGIWGTPTDLSKRNWETRQEFLARVRQAFESQYLSIKNSTKESEKNEKIWKKKLRKSLLTCVVKDSSLCAHVIVQNDPSKYSDADSNDKSSKLNETIGSTSVDKEIPAKHKKAVTLNGIHTTTKNRKNGECLKNDYGNGDEKLVTSNMTEIKSSRNINNPQNTVHLNGSLKPNGSKIEIKSPISLNGKKSKSKDSKRFTKQDGAEDKSLLEIKNKPQPSKRKPRKGTTKSTGDLFNGIDTNQIGAADKEVVNSTTTGFSHKIIKDTNSINNYVNGMNGSTSVISKKRKLEMCDENEPSGMDATSTFRVPKLEDSTSTNFNSIDVKMENGHLLSNSFNAHLSNHSLFHPNSTSSANTALATAQLQLQQILSQPDLRSLASHNSRNQGLDTVLNSVGSSDIGTSDGVITDASFDSTFDHSASSQQDCEFSDDDLEKSLEFQLDPETEHQASRLLEDNELTEDDLNELFPETRIGDNKIGRSDLSDLGIDFTSTFDANDIDYSLFANIFPFTRTNQSESISVTNQF